MVFDQTAAKEPVTESDLQAWKMVADAEAANIRLGGVNWVMIVRSLIAEIRRLQKISDA